MCPLGAIPNWPPSEYNYKQEVCLGLHIKIIRFRGFASSKLRHRRIIVTEIYRIILKHDATPAVNGLHLSNTRAARRGSDHQWQRSHNLSSQFPRQMLYYFLRGLMKKRLPDTEHPSINGPSLRLPGNQLLTRRKLHHFLSIHVNDNSG